MSVKCSDRPWQPWTPCFQNKQQRIRDIGNGCNNSDNAPLREDQSCMMPMCSSLSWGTWNPCTNGVEYRSRNGNPVLCDNSDNSDNSFSEQRSCYDPNKVLCSSFPWSDWESCSDGRQRRRRIITTACDPANVIMEEYRDCLSPQPSPTPTYQPTQEETQQFSLAVRILIFIAVIIVLILVAYGEYYYYKHNYLGHTSARFKYKYGFITLWFALLLIAMATYYFERKKLLFF